MLPEIRAYKIKEQVYAYLESTFEFNDPELRSAFLDFFNLEKHKNLPFIFLHCVESFLGLGAGSW